MDDLEMNIMRDAAKLIRYYSGHIPAKNDNGARAYWDGFCEDLIKYAQRYDNHRLSIEMGAAVMSYLEYKGGYTNDSV